jgi:hypothetical protein
MLFSKIVPLIMEFIRQGLPSETSKYGLNQLEFLAERLLVGIPFSATDLGIMHNKGKRLFFKIDVKGKAKRFSDIWLFRVDLEFQLFPTRVVRQSSIGWIWTNTI